MELIPNTSQSVIRAVHGYQQSYSEARPLSQRAPFAIKAILFSCLNVVYYPISSIGLAARKVVRLDLPGAFKALLKGVRDSLKSLAFIPVALISLVFCLPLSRKVQFDYVMAKNALPLEFTKCENINDESNHASIKKAFKDDLSRRAIISLVENSITHEITYQDLDRRLEDYCKGDEQKKLHIQSFLNQSLFCHQAFQLGKLQTDLNNVNLRPNDLNPTYRIKLHDDRVEIHAIQAYQIFSESSTIGYNVIETKVTIPSIGEAITLSRFGLTKTIPTTE